MPFRFAVFAARALPTQNPASTDREASHRAATRSEFLTRSRHDSRSFSKREGIYPSSDLWTLRASLETIVGQKPLNLLQTFDNLKQNGHTLPARYTFRSANFTDDLGETVTHALRARRESQLDLDQVIRAIRSLTG